MVNPNQFNQWAVELVRNGLKTSKMYHYYQEDPFNGPMNIKTFQNRISEVRAILKAVDSSTPPKNHETTVLETNQREHDLEVALRSFQIQTEWDVRKILGYEDEEKYKCKGLRSRPVQNEKNPYYIIEARFEETSTIPLLEVCRVELPKISPVPSQPTQAALVLQDAHIPFHDPRTFDIALQVAKELQPTHIILNGDMLDATDLSKWPADIEHRNRIQESLIILAQFIGQLKQASPSSIIVYLEGNHCHRLRKEILKSVAAAAGLKRVSDLNGFEVLSVPHLLCLEESGVKWVPYTEPGYWLHPKLKFFHGEELNVGKMAKERNYSMVVGHGHRVELATTANEHQTGQSENFTQMFGCMCLLDGSVPSSKTVMNWQQSIGVVYYDGELSNPVPIMIHEGKALFNGKMFLTAM